MFKKNLAYKENLNQIYPEKQRAFSQILDQVRLAIENSRLNYHEKLSNKLLSNTFTSNCHWSILKKV